MQVWRTLTDEEKLDLVYRRYILGVEVDILAREIGMKTISLNRNLQAMRKALDDNDPDWMDNVDVSDLEEEGEERIEFPKEKSLPENHELFEILRKRPVSLQSLSEKFDRSVSTIKDMIDRMELAGYVIERERNTVHVDTAAHPKVEFSPARTLADEQGQEIIFGVVSDTHAGSTHSQPSAINSFVKIAYEDYGIRHIFMPGDLTAGVGGYRGQNLDLLPSIRPYDRTMYPQTTTKEVWLADQYIPQYDGLTYYVLGGNHDYWHITNSGIDAVRQFCNNRPDAIYLGYDVGDIPLTDRASVRLWHPSGGVPYSVSYRMQKGLEQVAFEELTRAIEENDNPKVRMLLAGHLHVEAKISRGPLVAAQVGCFEGQTNYLKRKGLYPQIGGCIFKLHLTDTGLVQRVLYEFISYTEVEDDWKNWPVEEVAEFDFRSEKLETLFRLA